MKRCLKNCLICMSGILIIAVCVSCGSSSFAGGSTTAIDTVTPSEIMGMIQDLSDISGYGLSSGIHPGPKADQASKYIENKLAGYGLTVKREPVKVISAWPNSYKVTVDVTGSATREIVSFPAMWTVATPTDGVQAELAYVGDGTKSNFDTTNVSGKIVLIDSKAPQGYQQTMGANYTNALATAVQKGAIGFIVADLEIPVPKITHGAGRPGALLQIPGVMCGKSEGDYLRGLVQSGKNPKVKMMLDLPYQQYTNDNVYAVLPGNASTDETIIVCGHYDTTFTGALDNNGGVATILGLAKYFAQKPRESRNRDIMFLFIFGHDTLFNIGHKAFADNHKDLLKKAITVDVDHPVTGFKYVYDRTQGKWVTTSEWPMKMISATSNPLLTMAAFSLYKWGLLPVTTFLPVPGQGANNGDFIAAGAAGVFTGINLPYYYHTIDDTPEKLSVKQIETSFPYHVEIVENIDRTPGGYLLYADVNKNRPNTPPRVRIAVLSDTVKVGDAVCAWNDETFFSDDKPVYSYAQFPDWAGMTWDWGDGSTVTKGQTGAHAYKVAGTYTITLTVTDLEGATGKDIRQITVK